MIRSTIRTGLLSIAALAMSVTLALAQGHTSTKFSGAKVNAGTVTHSVKDGKNVLTLSSEFQIPDTPDPHWQVVDSKGNTFSAAAPRREEPRRHREGQAQSVDHAARLHQGRREGADLLRMGRGRSRRGVVPGADGHDGQIARPPKRVGAKAGQLSGLT